MRNSPGSFTGTVLGLVCLIGGVGLRLFAPEFRGFFDRGHSEPSLPVWALLLFLAALNFGYAAFSYFVMQKSSRSGKSNPEDDSESGGGEA